jgi:hypothetical protein
MYNHINLVAPKPLTLGNEIALVNQKLAERGEKLQEINDKTQRLEQASKNFADTMKQYNEQQSKKRWWQ